MKLRELIEELNSFERERTPIEIRILGGGDIHSDIFNEEDGENSL